MGKCHFFFHLSFKSAALFCRLYAVPYDNKLGLKCDDMPIKKSVFQLSDVQLLDDSLTLSKIETML